MAALSVAVFTGSRADLSPLAPVLDALAHEPTVHLLVLAGLGHDEQSIGTDLRCAGVTGQLDVAMVARRVTTAERDEIVRYGPDVSRATADVLAGRDVDVLVVLGDRWELLSVVPPAVLLGVPVVHLHGGEVTEGALDERVRHAVTKLADAHCVATEDGATRVRQMGEPPDRIHITGAPGLDRLPRAEPLDDGEFQASFGIALQRPLVLLTYHPPTAVPGADVRRWAREVLDETAAAAGTTVATWPGLDPGHAEVLEEVTAAANRHASVVAVEKLGPLFARMLATADAVVGNSSSGIIEAASVALPVLDIGERQRGRLRGGNVVDADEGADAVRAGLAVVLDPAFRASLHGMTNPYGDGRAADRIVAVVKQVAQQGAVAKPFFDLTG